MFKSHGSRLTLFNHVSSLVSALSQQKQDDPAVRRTAYGWGVLVTHPVLGGSPSTDRGVGCASSCVSGCPHTHMWCYEGTWLALSQ